MEKLNPIRFRKFREHATADGATELHVERRENARQVVVKYNARGRSKSHNGEWILEKRSRDEEALNEAEASFYDQVAKDFIVVRHGEAAPEVEVPAGEEGSEDA